MTMTEYLALLQKYEKCPCCGCTTVGNGTGVLGADTEVGFFHRACRCGWSVTIKNGSFSAIYPNPPMGGALHDAH